MFTHGKLTPLIENCPPSLYGKLNLNGILNPLMSNQKIYHGCGVRYTMDWGFNMPYARGKNTMGRGQNTIGRGFDTI
jgi:hypothetical protein